MRSIVVTLFLSFLLVSCGAKSEQSVETLRTIAETRRGVPARMRDLTGFVDEITTAGACSAQDAEISKLRQISQRAKDVAAAYEKDQTASNEDQAVYAIRRIADSLQVDVLSLHCLTEEGRYRYDKTGGLARQMADTWQEMFRIAPLGKK